MKLKKIILTSLVTICGLQMTLGQTQTLLLTPTHLAKTAPGTRFLLLPGIAENPNRMRSAFAPYRLPLPEFIDDETKGVFMKSISGGEVFAFKRLEEVKSSTDGKPSGIMVGVFSNNGKDWAGVLETPAKELKAQTAGQGTQVQELFPEEHLQQLQTSLQGKRLFSPNCGWWEVKNGKLVNADTPSLSWIQVDKVTLATDNMAPVRVWFTSEHKSGLYKGRYFMDLDPYSKDGSFSLSHCLRTSP